ncbi:MAG: adenosylmethionine--8-amino-7-oxononanoate transaminase [Verrucomicrobiota bacterium]|jgi:adenosylmethionine-8-amino-7-oxononanoate aminotransferase|nr:adenosylmethionine--8-amino-7-oxononanoate transaminase [Verrucomicrobiota bacterium]
MKKHPLAKLDQRYLWHPFTQMRDWLQGEPLVIERGDGARLWDARGREYLDANSSIWTNLHGHNHPKLNAAICTQLDKVAHTSALGLASGPAARLGQSLVKLANPRSGLSKGQPRLAKVFYSDDGSTAVEVALKLAYEFARRTGRARKPRFLSLDGAYHGDTVGAVSAGHIDLFHKAYSGMLFKTDKVMSPYCYRCPFNKAKPERGDARDTRKCKFECVDKVEQRFAARKKRGSNYAAMLVEPGLQGPAGMIAQPAGWLRRVAGIARGHGVQLIADEVMTGLGRATNHFFANHDEGVQPDYLCLAKGLTGGYLPMAATLTSREVFDAFLGDYAEFKTFFHGHSYTGNALGSAASLASIELLQTKATAAKRKKLANNLRAEAKRLWGLPQVGDIRQAGCVLAVELVRDWRTREPFTLAKQAGIRVCDGLAKRGVLTRPIGNVIVIMPPFCTTQRQVKKIFAALHDSIDETLNTP